MITLRNIEKSYPVGPGRYYVLRRITADIAEGEFVTIMGPSGAGKTTLLSILGMLDGAWEGEYYLMERPVHKMNLKQRAESGSRPSASFSSSTISWTALRSPRTSTFLCPTGISRRRSARPS